MVAPIARSTVVSKQALLDDKYKRVTNFLNRFDHAVSESNFTPPKFRDEVIPNWQQARRFLDQIAPILRHICDPYSAQKGRKDGQKDCITVGRILFKALQIMESIGWSSLQLCINKSLQSLLRIFWVVNLTLNARRPGLMSQGIFLSRRSGNTRLHALLYTSYV